MFYLRGKAYLRRNSYELRLIVSTMGNSDFSFNNIFRALQNKNFRLFFIGQNISLTGTWMQQVALSWLVYRLTHSAFLLGAVGFAGQIPTFLIAPIAGVVADRYNRRRLLILTQTLAMLQAGVLAALVLSQRIEIWHVIVLSVFIGIVNAFDMPVRQAFTIEMIEKKENLSNAIALNSSMVNLARLTGPAVAGILIALFGEGLCFFLNAASYVAVIISLLLMKMAAPAPIRSRGRILSDLKEGFFYVNGFIPIRYILLLVALVSFMGVPYQILMPVFVTDIFHQGPQTLGFLMGMAGAGALTGAIYLASRKTVLGLGRIIARATGVFGLALVLFSWSHVLWSSMILVFMAGLGMMVQMAASNIILQTVVEENKRGRVMSFYAMAFMGTVPFGSLFAGMMAARIGAPMTLTVGGIFCLAGAVFFWRKLPAIRSVIRPVYMEKGIIAEATTGVNYK